MGLNDVSAENKQSVNDCGHNRDELSHEHSRVPPSGRILYIFQRPVSAVNDEMLLPRRASHVPTSAATHVGWLELVDDGGLAAVVQAQTQHVDLLLPEAQPPRQLIQQPHCARLGCDTSQVSTAPPYVSPPAGNFQTN